MSELNIYRTVGYNEGEEGLKEAEAFFGGLVPGDIIETEQWSSTWFSEAMLPGILKKDYKRLFIIHLINLPREGNNRMQAHQESRDVFLASPETEIEIESVKNIGSITYIEGGIQWPR